MDWRTQFAEVFDANGGFDVVMANPPYVRQELIRPIKPALQRAYGNLYTGTADLYVYFYLRSLELLRDGGMFVFISSNKRSLEHLPPVEYERVRDAVGAPADIPRPPGCVKLTAPPLRLAAPFDAESERHT